MEYPLRRAAETSFYYVSPYAKRAKTAAVSFVKKKISTGIKRAIERRIDGRAVRPSEVRSIVNRQIASNTDKRFFGEIQPLLSSKRTFTSQLLCSRIGQGVTGSSRTGEKIHLREFTTKFAIVHIGITPTAQRFDNKSGLAAPVYLNMFLVKSRRSDNLETYWFKNITDDGDASFSDPLTVGTPQTTALSDANRAQSRFNTDDYTILKQAKCTIAPVMAQGDKVGDSYQEFTFTHKWNTPALIQYNVNATATTPYAPTDLSQRYYFVTYLSQPDSIADDAISNVQCRSTSYTYFNDN